MEPGKPSQSRLEIAEQYLRPRSLSGVTATCCRRRFDRRRWDGAWEETAVAFADAARPVPLTAVLREPSTVSAPSVSGTVSANSTPMKDIEATTIASANFI
jgi:hypothetical protein